MQRSTRIHRRNWLRSRKRTRTVGRWSSLTAVGCAAMPISSGANRWPKSYWNKPSESQRRQSRAYEGRTASERRSMSRAMSLPGAGGQDGDWRTKFGGLPAEASDRNQPKVPAVVRSPAVVVPLPVDRSRQGGRDAGHTGQPQPRPPLGRTGRVAPSNVSVVETSSTTTTWFTTLCPLKRSACMKSVSTARFSLRLLHALVLYFTWSRVLGNLHFTTEILTSGVDVVFPDNLQ